MLTIELPAEIESRLQTLVQMTGRSATACVHEAIVDYLDHLEDVSLAQQRLEDLRSGTTQAIPIEQVMKRYGMEG